jgi:hypothetical protein
MQTRWETSTRMTKSAGFDQASPAATPTASDRRIVSRNLAALGDRQSPGCRYSGSAGANIFASAASILPWLWIAPLLALIPALILCARHAYRPAEIAALADSLDGGHGTLLTIFETGAAHPFTMSQFRMPRLRPWRKLSAVLAAAGFLVVALLVPQRIPAADGRTVLANDVVAI